MRYHPNPWIQKRLLRKKRGKTKKRSTGQSAPATKPAFGSSKPRFIPVSGLPPSRSDAEPVIVRKVKLGKLGRKILGQAIIAKARQQLQNKPVGSSVQIECQTPNGQTVKVKFVQTFLGVLSEKDAQKKGILH